jgi:hypothetical protein
VARGYASGTLISGPKRGVTYLDAGTLHNAGHLLGVYFVSLDRRGGCREAQRGGDDPLAV